MPRLEQRNGYKAVVNTGWENFSAFLQSALQNAMAIQQQKQQAKLQADATRQQQAEFHAMLAQIGEKNPEIYNELITIPTVQQFLDPNRANEIGRGPQTFVDYLKNRNKPKVPGAQLTPITGDAMTAFQSKRSAGLATDAATVAQSSATVDMSQLTSMLAKHRQGLLSSDDLVEQLQGFTGNVPSPTDVAVAGGKVNPSVAAVSIPGTLEWKNNQVNMLMADMTKQYKITDASDLAKVRALAEYQVGIRSEAPQKLPQAYAQLQLDMDMKGLELRQKQFGLDAARYAQETRMRELTFATDLMQRGIQPNIAMSAAQQYMRQGTLPDGMTIPPNMKDEADLQLTQLRIQQAQEDLRMAAVNDPEVAGLLRLIDQFPTQADEGPTKINNPYFRKLQSIMQSKYGWETTAQSNPSLWQKIQAVWAMRGTIADMPGQILRNQSGAPAGPASKTGMDISAPVSSPEVEESTPEPERKPTTEAKWTPQLEQAGEQAANRSMQMYLSLDPAGKARLANDMRKLAAARSQSDPIATAQALKDIEDTMRLLGAPAGGQ